MHTNLSTRIRNICLGLMLVGITLFCHPATTELSLASPQIGRLLQPTINSTVNTQSLAHDPFVNQHIISDPRLPPSCFEDGPTTGPLPKSNSTRARIPDSLFYEHGCAAVSAEISSGGLDRGGRFIQSGIQAASGVVWVNMNVYPNLYTGPTNGGVMPSDNSAWPSWTDVVGDTYPNNPLIASHMGVDGRATRGTIDDYWVSYESTAPDPYITGGWSQHAWGDAIGDYMYTSQSAFGNRDGETQFFTYANSADPYTCDVMSSTSNPDGTLGIKQFYQARGYAVGACYNQPTDNVIAGGFSFAQFKAEIDAGWPVLLGLESHSVLGIGYDAALNLVYLYNGWDSNIHTMEWKEGCYDSAKNCSVSYKYKDIANDFNLPLRFVSIVRIVPGVPNFYTISGNVGVANATITYTGGSTTSDTNGNYSFSVSESWFGTVTPAKAGYTFRPTNKSYANVTASQTAQNYNDLNLLLDPSFEAYTPNPYWTEASTNFGTPLCTAACLQAGATSPGPHTGAVWGWFGGTSDNETASLSQTLPFPSGSATLSFSFWISGADPGSDTGDTFAVKIDNTTIFAANATQTSLYPTYTLVSLDVSAFANGGSHKVTFESVTTGQQVDFNLDDVSLIGTVTISGNAGLAGATLNYIDGTNKTVTTNGSGSYSITVPLHWSGTVTPSKAGYTFSPANRVYNDLQNNQTGQNYAAAPITYTISGNAGAGGVTLSYTDGTPKTATADGNGNYAFQVPAGWSGTVTPSKSGYIFSPLSRTYTNVLDNQLAQDFAAQFVSYAISGTVQVGGVALNYVDGIPKTIISLPDGSYSLPVPAHWSGAVTPTHSCFTFSPTSRSYNNVTANQTGQNYTQTFNNASGCADVSVLIGGSKRGEFAILPHGSTRVSFPGVNGGPVNINSLNSIPIIAAERVIYKFNGVNTSFTEMMGLADSQLDKVYWLPWYNNVDLDTQLRIGNVSGSTATVHIFIGGTEVTPVNGINLGTGASTRLSYLGVNNGPVKIQSNQNIVAAERLIYKFSGLNTSFAEMMALPNSQLTTTYWLPWYNNADLDTQLRIGNVTNNQATIHIFIGGAEVTPLSGLSLDAGASTRLSYPGVNNGPVKIQSNQNIVAAERVIYKVNGLNTSFTEMMALPNSQLTTTYWLPWYNNADLDTQLRFGNVSANIAHVHVYVGGVEMPGSPFTLGVGQSTRVSFGGVNNGPVKVQSDQNIVAAERVIYKVNNVNTSFSEMMGLPNSQLNAAFWLPWYNNLDLDTQLRFGVP